ncbi:MAG TPA: hypothetical protein VH165_17360 [Kofleriaceae bacterium]|nr:hypothetical protein [Kofleriaceae bacterium]
MSPVTSVANRAARLAWLALAACGAPQATTAPEVPPAGQLASGGTVRVELAGDRIARLPAIATPAGAGAATWLWPPIIDSHVHLTYWPVADELARSGIAAVVDLAAPEATLDAAPDAHGTPAPDAHGDAAPGAHGTPALHVLAAGPMLTHPGGYPLSSWGRDGYGLPCRDPAEVTAAIDRLARRGARVIKLALDDDGLDPALIPVAVAAAHARHLKVAVHALGDASAAAAGRAGVDLLAHTPVEPLADATVALWRGRAVISTLAAFGGRPAAIDNLRRLRAAGATILYGTDLGNTRIAGPNPDEIALLRRAGLDDAAITDAMTTAPAAYWSLPFTVSATAEASFLVLDADPRRDATTLLAPRAIWLRGHRLR